MKSVAYIRVSTTDQHLENQKIYLNREAERSDDSISHFNEDHGISGVKNSRPSLNQLLDDARKNKFGRLYVYDLFRLSRSVKHLLETVQILKDLDIELIFVKERINTSNPTGRFFMTTISALYELEREMIRKRSLVGIERAKREGKVFGRPKIITDNLKSAVKILRDEGVSIRKIASQVGISVGSVYACL
jgi:DNA invertase Pin-like site-specific DNA recombinase